MFKHNGTRPILPLQRAQTDWTEINCWLENLVFEKVQRQQFRLLSPREPKAKTSRQNPIA